MKSKKIIASLMALTLILSLMGCGDKSNNLNTDNDAKAEQVTEVDKYTMPKDYEPKKMTEDDIMTLGEKQTADMKTIVSKYGYDVKPMKIDYPRNILYVSTDKTNCVYSLRGYEAETSALETDVMTGKNKDEYFINYNASVREEPIGLDYEYTIDIRFHVDKEEFVLDDYKMFKELVCKIHGDDYDFDELDKTIQKTIQQFKTDIKTDEDARPHIINKRFIEPYKEEISFSYGDSIANNELTYRVTLPGV